MKRLLLDINDVCDRNSFCQNRGRLFSRKAEEGKPLRTHRTVPKRPTLRASAARSSCRSTRGPAHPRSRRCRTGPGRSAPRRRTSRPSRPGSVCRPKALKRTIPIMIVTIRWARFHQSALRCLSSRFALMSSLISCSLKTFPLAASVARWICESTTSMKYPTITPHAPPTDKRRPAKFSDQLCHLARK